MELVLIEKKSHMRQMPFGLKMARRHNSGSTLRIFFEILHNEADQEVH